MNYRIIHKTTYRYTDPVSLCHNKAHLIPREHDHQKVLSHKLIVIPEPAVSGKRKDYFGNEVVFFAVQEPHRELIVEVQSEVNVRPSLPPDELETVRWETAVELIRADLTTAGLDAYEFVFDSPHVQTSKDLHEYALASFPPAQPILAGLVDLNRRIFKDFKYTAKATTVSTPIREVMERRVGVCQDFAHLMIGCLRSLGLPARYISGYLLTTPPPGTPRLIGADASHAWVSAYIPGFGWVDFDPTNNCIPGEKHITLVWGRDYGDVSPLRGVILGGGRQSLSVSVDVAPI